MLYPSALDTVQWAFGNESDRPTTIAGSPSRGTAEN